MQNSVLFKYAFYVSAILLHYTFEKTSRIANWFQHFK